LRLAIFIKDGYMRKSIITVIALLGVVASGSSVAASPVQGIFQQGTLPKFAGVQADIYITGGGTVDYASNFNIFANGHFLCSTQNESYSTTPIRHCKAVIPNPGTYTISATATTSGQNFIPPANAIINVD
jgi:hypothetical protein